MDERETISQADGAAKGVRSDSLRSKSFVGLLCTQWLGAMNDNILRWLVIGVGKQYVEPSQVNMVLSVGTMCFVVPYLILAAPAGYLADRFDKRRVIVGCKLAEFAIVGSGILAIYIGNIYFLFAVVAAMGAQSALFGPAKLGSIPEMLKSEKISSANGLLGLTTVVATVAGTAVGNLLSDATMPKGQHQWWISAAVMLGIAGAGYLASLAIARLPAADSTRRFPWDAPAQTVRDLMTLAQSRAMLRVALGIMFFWSLGALAQLNIDQYGVEGGALRQSQITPLLIALVTGVGAGSVLAGIWSGGRVELGILPLGAGGVAISSILLYTVQGAIIDPSADWTASYVAACGFLVLLGISAGLFDVPLAAYMQHHSPPESRGSILAASNFLTFSGMALSAGAFALLRTQQPDGEPLFTARQIFLLCGLFTIPVFIYIICLIPQASIRFLVWLATHTVYRVRVFGDENLPERGGALLVANHVTWLDAVLLTVTSSRPLRLVVDADLIQGPLRRWLARTMGAIPIRPTPKALTKSMAKIRKALDSGELVCMFPEGAMTRDGRVQPFKRASLAMLDGLDVPTIPVYLDELFGSIFSYQGEKIAWSRPHQWPYPVSVWFGSPLAATTDVRPVQQALTQLGAHAVHERSNRQALLPEAFLQQCRRKRFKSKIADSTGTDMTGGNVLLRTLILRRLLLRDVLQDGEQHVGILLPPSAGGVLANAAVALCGRVAVNLNYTLANDVLNNCIAQAKIKHVLTSRKVTEKLDLKLDAEIVYLEDFKAKVTLADKLASLAWAHVAPLSMLKRKLGIDKLKLDDPLTIIFTSGSTGQPKGVVLTQGNILSNTAAIEQVIRLRSDDVFIGILPFFHSFGFTVTLWTVLGNDVKGAYHFTPLEPRQVGKLCQKHRGTALLATPTFLRSYLRRCNKEELDSLEVVVVGAEKMPIDLAEGFEEKFGVRPVEGYGATETSPLVSVNIPPSRSASTETDLKEGTVGRCVPGVEAKVVDPALLEAGEVKDLGINQPGMLLIAGGNVMQGYLGMPEKTAEVVRDGWYVTGDIAEIDAEGFIKITGRLSRFSKVGGEMVPHVGIEDEILQLLSGAGDAEEAASVFVAGVPDERKGEKIVVLYKNLIKTPQEICKALAERGLPNLWIPSADSFYQVEEIPILGTGKTDLKAAQQLAKELAGKC